YLCPPRQQGPCLRPPRAKVHNQGRSLGSHFIPAFRLELASASVLSRPVGDSAGCFGVTLLDSARCGTGLVVTTFFSMGSDLAGAVCTSSLGVSLPDMRSGSTD